uniref:SOWAHA-C winged helix-turn-helix domain-containing protein n=1 Tax=Anopheles atroparvus TaxID=41427 RepID=A0A182JMB3_ANOAO
MENQPKELSLVEIRKFMLQNNCKVTNHALVKHFRSFLTNKDTQDDARKQFKTYVNVLASIKHEGNEKYLVLRRKFFDDIPSEDSLNMTVSQPMSPASRSYGVVPSDGEASPMRLPPPYRPPPVVSPDAVSYQGSPRGSVALNRRNSSEIGRSGSEISFGSEFASVDVKKVNPLLVRSNSSDTRQTHDVGRRQSADVYKFDEAAPPAIPPRKRISDSGSNSVPNSRQNSVEEKLPVPVVEGPGENKENVPAADTDETGTVATEENKLSVKEKMMKFNRFASEEEAKIPSPIGKKKPEKTAKDGGGLGRGSLKAK